MSQPIHVVTSADNNFAIGLAGTMKSVMSHLGPTSTMKLWVLDGGITTENKDAISKHLSDPRLTIEFVSVDRKLVSKFVVSHHVTDATYYRLLTPEILPPSVKKFIYLDSDLLVRRDITDLWNIPLDGAPCLAIQDSGAPFCDCKIALPNHSQIYVANYTPIPNYRELQLDPRAPYFNGGVLVIDLELWRREKLATKMLQVLDVHREHVTYWDQYALNVVLSGRWKQIDSRWNQIAFTLNAPSHANTIYSEQEFASYVNAPYIVHFTYKKPWQEECTHPRAAEFFEHLEGTPWASQRPVWNKPEPVVFAAPATPAKPKPYYRRKFREVRDYVRSQIRGIKSSAKALFRRAA